jgi:hypothetical protein
LDASGNLAVTARQFNRTMAAPRADAKQPIVKIQDVTLMLTLLLIV